MKAIESKICRVMLCPVDYTEMISSEIPWVVDEVQMIPSRSCTVAGCPYRYTLSGGYLKSQEDEAPKPDQALRLLCPVHRHPLYISEYDSRSKTETWRCPETDCETIKRRRLG